MISTPNMKIITFSHSNMLIWVVLLILFFLPTQSQSQSLKIKAGCDSVVLDVLQPGAAYSWSTGDTSAMLTILRSDTVWVDITQGGNTVRDSFVVWVFSSAADPHLTDTTICFGEEVILDAGQGAGTVLWYDDSVGGNIVARGDSLKLLASQTQTFYVQRFDGFFPSHAGLDTLNAGGSGGGYITSTGRSLLFNAKEDFFLSQVTLHSNNAVTGKIVLYDPSGTVIDSLDISLPGAGAHDITLDFFIRQANGYKLGCNDIAGGSIFLEFPVSFPLSYQALDIRAGRPVGIVYSYFYNWQINKDQYCASNRKPVTITVLPSPEVELGIDTVICDNDSLTLDATFPGASYTWSTGDTLPIIKIGNSDTVRVELTMGQCKAEDEVIIYGFQSPTDPLIQDSSICSKGDITLKNQSNGTIVWYDKAGNDAVILALSDSLSLSVTDTTSVYVEAVNGFIPRSTGLKEPTAVGGSGFYPSGGRSLIFNANKDFYLTSVTIYTDNPVTGRVVLEDNLSNELKSQDVNLPQVGANEATLNFFVQRGNGYRLTFKDLNGGGLYLQFPVPFPITSEFVNITGGTPVGFQYSYFYDWKINHNLSCNSNRVKNTVSVAIPDYLVDSVFACDSITISSQQPHLNHLWSTGDTTDSITVDKDGIYIVELNDGANCMIYDTIAVEIPTVPGLPIDGVLCGTTLSTNFGLPSQFQWSTGDTTPTIMISQPGTYWVNIIEERGNCFRTDTISVNSFASFPVVDLGMDLTGCDSAVFDAGNPGQVYFWSTGDTTQQITIVSTGSYWVDVTTAVGCTTRDTATATISRSPQANFFPSVLGFDVSINNLSTLTTTFMWDFGDGTQKSGPMPRHTYIDTGMFTITLVVVNSCGSDTFTQVVHIQDPTRPIDDPFLGKISFFPNPASGELTLQIKDMGIAELKLQLVDLTGKQLKVWQVRPQSISSTHQVRLPQVPAGLYLLRIQAKEQEAFYKLQIKQ